MVVLLVALATFVLSVFSTLTIDRLLLERISILGTTIGLERTTNAGIAFGINPPGWLLAILIPLALIIIIYIAWKQQRSLIHSIGFGLIIGGAFGNIIDRLNDGMVTDFIQIGWWPLFNVADSCITVGVGMLLAYEMITKKERH